MSTTNDRTAQQQNPTDDDLNQDQDQQQTDDAGSGELGTGGENDDAPASGYMKFNPRKYDRILGDMLDLTK